ncbi:MAG: hypothetical protein AAF664_20140, partial [Planctomycetota bacterium]
EAIASRWPTLEQRVSEVVVRFMDPAETDNAGRPLPVVNVMLPWSHLHEEVLRSQVIIDGETGNRLPSLEAAVAAKYAAMVSPNRMIDKKGQDAVDFRRLVGGNLGNLNIDELGRLAELVWEGATPDMLELIDAVKNEKPFEL